MMEITGSDHIVIADTALGIVDILLRELALEWPMSMLQVADETDWRLLRHFRNSPITFTEFFVYRDHAVACDWQSDDVTDELKGTMIHFAVQNDTPEPGKTTVTTIRDWKWPAMQEPSPLLHDDQK